MVVADPAERLPSSKRRFMSASSASRMPPTREHMIAKLISTAFDRDRGAIIGEFDTAAEGR